MFKLKMINNSYHKFVGKIKTNIQCDIYQLTM